MVNVRMRSYRIIVEDADALSAGDFRKVVNTIQRGLYNTEFTGLMTNVTSVASGLIEEVNDEGRELLLKLVEQFNVLDTTKLNRRLLDNAKLPMESAASQEDDTRAPAWFSAYTENFGAKDGEGRPTRAASIVAVDELERQVNALQDRIAALESKKDKRSSQKSNDESGGDDKEPLLDKLFGKAKEGADKVRADYPREAQFSPKQQERRRKAAAKKEGGEQ